MPTPRSKKTRSKSKSAAKKVTRKKRVKKAAAKKPAAKKAAAKKGKAKAPKISVAEVAKLAAAKMEAAAKMAAEMMESAAAANPPPPPRPPSELWQAGDGSEALGELHIASGKVSVADAGALMDPVEIELTPGGYEVRVRRDESGLNLAAVLAAKGAQPVSWEQVGEYPVDAGMSGFFDGALFGKVSNHGWEISIYDDLICNHLDPAEAQGHAGALVPFEGAHFSACKSGYGDGIYPVHIGRDAAGSVVAVVTTFE